MIFSSKKDIWMGTMIWASIALFSWILYKSAFIQFSMFGLLIMAPLIGLLIWIWFCTRYEIDHSALHISYGPIRKTIRITDIESIHATTNPFAAPALSVYRIEILYKRYETISISPQDRKEFIRELQKRNPSIQLMDRHILLR